MGLLLKYLFIILIFSFIIHLVQVQQLKRFNVHCGFNEVLDIFYFNQKYILEKLASIDQLRQILEPEKSFYQYFNDKCQFQLKQSFHIICAGQQLSEFKVNKNFIIENKESISYIMKSIKQYLVKQHINKIQVDIEYCSLFE